MDKQKCGWCPFLWLLVALFLGIWFSSMLNDVSVHR
jgi:hypothetical protein